MKDNEKIVLAGGCFWCTESVFREINGTKSVRSGYSGGHQLNPTYEEVCEGKTGHAEAVEINFDKDKVALDTLLDIFFLTHDPTQLNRQGNDIGTQYRSAIFYNLSSQEPIISDAIRRARKIWNKTITTEVNILHKFYYAEDYHNNYYINNPNSAYCQSVINPKMKKFRTIFSNFLKVNN